MQDSIDTNYIYDDIEIKQVENLNLNLDENGIESFYTNPENEIDGISVLVHFAKIGKLDPWNIDIVDVTNKYMSFLFEMKSKNLKLMGRTILFAAILLNLKSKAIAGLNPLEIETEQDDNDFDDSFEPDYEDAVQLKMNNVISLDEVLERRTSTRLNVKRSVTLDDLIEQLEFYEELDKKQRIKNTFERAKRRVKNYSKFTADDIINIAHDEYIEDSVAKLHENLINIFEKEEKVELNTLTLLGMDKISAYIALLFLSARTDYELVQDEFYSDLYVIKGSPSKEVEA